MSASPKADLILHPVRMRLLTELGQRHLTPGQMAERLPDIAQATLYRHLKALHDGGVLEIVAETPVNGATERTYRVKAGQSRLTPEELAQLSRDELLQAFQIFTANLLDHFAAYVRHSDGAQASADGLSFNLGVVYLSDAEREHLQTQLTELVGQMLHNPPSPERQRYTLASVVIPEAKPTASKASEETES